MKRFSFSRLAAAVLTCSLLLAPAAQALTVEQAAELLEQFYIDDVPQRVLEQTTIDGMMEALGDPYTEYFSAEEYQTFFDSLQGTSQVGIGIMYTVTEEGLLISRVIENSPAQRGRLAAGDLVVAADGQSLLGLTTEESAALLLGEEGSTVKLTYRRDGQRRTVTITRAPFTVPSVHSELVNGHIGYIQCTTFGTDTAQLFQQAIETHAEDATLWVVDLRDNTGGITLSAGEAAGHFAGPGAMFYLMDGSGSYSVSLHKEEPLTPYPVIVLVNENTASASEMFAGAIQSSGMGIVIGSRTYGKGVAQTVLDANAIPDYFPDGDAIKITFSRSFSPDGNTFDRVGVIPHVPVAGDYAYDIALLLSADAPKGEDDNVLRVDLTWRWHVDLDMALSDEYKPLFGYFLSRLPVGTDLWLWQEGDWVATDAGTLAEAHGLDYYEAPYFPDHDRSQYGEALSVMKTYGIVNGRTDGAFHPADNLTRAEFCQLLASALNCPVPTNPSPYADVAEDAWYAPAVVALSNMGLVQGMENDLFRPDEPMDHQQFITILGRMAVWMNMTLRQVSLQPPEDLDTMEALSGYADWSKEYVWLLSESQENFVGGAYSFLWDTAANIDPTALTTRDEAVYTIHRLLTATDAMPS